MTRHSQPPRVLVAGHVTLDRYGDKLLPGGGDVFAAAFLVALARKEELAACGRLAAAAASIVIEGRGASELHRLDEAYRRAKSVPARLTT